MNEHDGGKPPAAWLDHLREAKHWERLIAMATKSLEIDPDDPVTHRHLAWAYASSDQPAKMWPHVEFLLNRQPDEASSHHLAAVYYLDTQKHKRSWPHIQTLLQKNPNSGTYHYLACLCALRDKKVPLARRHIEQARKLAPEWVAAAHLEIRMDAGRERKASDAWARIRRLEKTLSLDPQNTGVLTTIGQVYLHELERPREAEQFFRKALFIEPLNKVRQGYLLEAIRARSLLYRTLSLPVRAGRTVVNTVRRRPTSLVLLVALGHWLAFAAWVLVLAALFMPCAKVYEWFVLLDATQLARLPRWLTPLAPVFRWPLWLRMSTCFAPFIGLWLVLLRLAFHLNIGKSLAVIGSLFGIHYAFVAAAVGVRKLRARIGRWQDHRRQRREAHLIAGQAAV